MPWLTPLLVFLLPPAFLVSPVQGGKAAKRRKSTKEKPVAVLNEKTLAKFLNSTKRNQLALVARVKKGSPKVEMFQSIVEDYFRYYNISLFQSASVWLPDSADGNRDASITIWRPHFEPPDSQEVKFKGAWDEMKIVRWAEKTAYPAISHDLDHVMYGWPTIKKKGWEATVAVFLRDSERADPIKPHLLEVIRPLVGKYTRWRFVFAEIASLSADALNMFTANSHSQPMISVLREKRRYVLEGADELRSPEVVRGFLADVAGKRVKPRWRSELPREEEDVQETGLFALTGDTFENYAFDKNKDVLVQFIGPDCEFCSRLEFALTELSQRASEQGWTSLGFLVAKMDDSKNDCHEEVTHGYPKLVLYPAVDVDRKMEMRKIYRGPYELDRLSAWILLNSRNLVGVKPAAGLFGKSAGSKREL